MATNLEKAKSQFKTSLWSEGISSALNIYSGIMGAKTAKKYGSMQKKAYDTQARLNTIATERNIGYQSRQTAQAINQIYREANKARGSQLAAMAAGGMSTASGSAQALAKSIGVSVGRDVSTLQANLTNSAYEQRRSNTIQNIMLEYQGQEAYQAGQQNANASIANTVSGLLSSFGSVAGKWQQYQNEFAKINADNLFQTTDATAKAYNPLSLVNVGQVVSPAEFSVSSLQGTTGTGLENFMNYNTRNELIKRARI